MIHDRMIASALLLSYLLTASGLSTG